VHVPVEIAHTPVEIAHTPVEVAHTPVEVVNASPEAANLARQAANRTRQAAEVGSQGLLAGLESFQPFVDRSNRSSDIPCPRARDDDDTSSLTGAKEQGSYPPDCRRDRVTSFCFLAGIARPRWAYVAESAMRESLRWANRDLANRPGNVTGLAAQIGGAPSVPSAALG
jgi:hypothetical protein